MTDINLLPIEFSQRNESSGTINSIRKIILILSGLFVVIVLIGIVGIVLLTRQIQSVSLSENSLRQQIQSLQASETQLFLIKDRIGKIDSILAANTKAENSLQTLDGIVASLPQNTSVTDVQIDGSSTIFTITGQDSLSTATFLNTLVTSGTYKTLTLKSFQFNQDAGYQVTLQTI